MCYKINIHNDKYDFNQERHYTEQEAIDVDFEDVFDSVKLEFGKNHEDWLTELLEKVDSESEEEQKLQEIKCNEVNTDSGELEFNVVTNKNNFEVSIKPTKYEVETKVSLEELIIKDNDKLIDEIIDSLGLDDIAIQDVLKDRQGESIGRIVI